MANSMSPSGVMCASPLTAHSSACFASSEQVAARCNARRVNRRVTCAMMLPRDPAAAMSEPFTMVIKNQFSELQRAGRAIEAFGERHSVSARIMFNVNLAVDEILTNIISYGYPQGGDHEIIIRLSLDAGTLVVVIEDEARPFDPLHTKAPETEVPATERPIGGLGIHLVRKVMDRLEYRREEGKNVLTMTKAVH